MPAVEDGRVGIELTGEEIELLRAGVGRWSGPTQLTDGFAAAMGFSGVPDSREQRQRIESLLREGSALLPIDWARALVATELAFVSDAVGDGVEWGTITGIRDEEAIRTLRSVQRKLARVTRSLIRSGLGVRPGA